MKEVNYVAWPVAYMTYPPGDAFVLSRRLPQIQIPLYSYHVHLVP